MSFKDKSWNQRFSKMGDEAEGIYQEIRPLGSTARFGWRRPKVSMQKMTATMRHMPDFYASAGYLIEVMGCGRDHAIKMKLSKWDSLKDWNSLQPVKCFFWNSDLREWAIIGWSEMVRLMGKARRQGVKTFPEGHEYVEILWDWMKEHTVEYE